MVKYYLPHIIFFAVFLAALIPVLYYYQRRNPNPRFRPGAGEMTMICVLALMLGGGASYWLGALFRSERDFMKEYRAKPDQGSGTSQEAPEPRDDRDDRRRGRKE